MANISFIGDFYQSPVNCRTISSDLHLSFNDSYLQIITPIRDNLTIFPPVNYLKKGIHFLVVNDTEVSISVLDTTINKSVKAAIHLLYDGTYWRCF